RRRGHARRAHPHLRAPRPAQPPLTGVAVDDLPPWARLLDEAGADDAEPAPEGGREAALRWRLVLGRFAEEPLAEAAADDPSEPSDDFVDRAEEASRIDRSLQFVYDRAFAKRAHRQVG